MSLSSDPVSSIPCRPDTPPDTPPAPPGKPRRRPVQIPPVSPLERNLPRRPDGTYRSPKETGPFRPSKEAYCVKRTPLPGAYAAAIDRALASPLPNNELHVTCRGLLAGAVDALRARAATEEIPTLTPRERNTLRFLIDLCRDLREGDPTDEPKSLDLGGFDADTIRLMLVEARKEKK